MDKQLRKLQLCQTKILEDIDKICADYELRYYLLGGTALGAVRHKGFIPWDDDLDVGMYRNDYEKFQRIIIENYSSKYFLQNCETDPNYPRVIAKVRLNGTIQQERSYESIGCHNGIYVDIFPIDYVKKPSGFGMWLRGVIIRLGFAYKTVKCGSNNRHFMKIKRLLSFIPKIIPNKWIDKLMHYACTKDNKKEREYSTIFLSGYGWKKQMHKSDVFAEGKYIEFEGRQFKGPSDINAFLSKLFGDYMVLPPKEKRVAHKLTKIDFGIYDAELEKELEGSM